MTKRLLSQRYFRVLEGIVFIQTRALALAFVHSNFGMHLQSCTKLKQQHLDYFPLRASKDSCRDCGFDMVLLFVP